MELIMDAYGSHEVAVSAMVASDEIILVTGRSSYSFVLEDPAERRGLLRGGSATGQTAYFCGTLDGPASFHASGIRPGARALFLVDDGASGIACRRFLTSTVREVHIIKRNGEPA